MNIKKGFTAVEVLIIIVIVGIMTTLGIVLYDKLTTSEESDHASIGREESKEYKELSNSSDIEPSSAKNFLEIPELGIKVELPSSLKGVYYSALDNKHASLSLEEFKGTNCSAEETSPVGISRYKESDFDHEHDPTVQSKKDRAKYIDGEYIFTSVGHATCSEDPEVQAKFNSIRSQISSLPPEAFHLIK